MQKKKPAHHDEDVFQGCKYLLRLKKPNDDIIHSIASDFNLSFPASRVLYSRGYESKEDIRGFLFSSFDKDVPDGFLLKDSQLAVDRILKAIKDKEKILIFGDYDVDGITSVSLFMITLLPLGASINFFLPNRERDGYGLSSSVVQKAKKSGYGLIITVDNGITAYEPAALARKLGIDLIITDHHRQHEKLPDAFAIVNPNQNDCPYPFKSLCGAAVAFKILDLVYKKKKLTLPEKAYELLTLGTIADVMPLNGENRFWVQHGLSKINKKRSYALSVLAHNSKLTKEMLRSLDIGFNIAPQINALGRLSDPRDGVKFLISSQRDEVGRIGRVLWEMNEARKRIERSVYDEVSLAIENKKIDLDHENIIVAAGSQWPSGVIGLIAGRLMNSYGRPSLMFHITSDGILKGSCRSIEEFNIFDALNENKDLLLKFGGHSCAAGLSLKQENLPELKERLEKKIADELTEYDLSQKKILDAELELPDVNKQLLSDLGKLEPFGHKNPVPTFLIHNVTILKKPRLLKDKHVKCSVFSDGVIKPIIFFNRPELFTFFETIGDKPFSVAASVVENEWDGRRNIELQGIDVVISDSP
jgi:single-stranded-DNA-specific exonuclease